MRKTIFTVIILLTLGCKNNSKINVKSDKQENKVESYLSVTVKAKVEEDDKFQLYFSEDITGQYHPDDIVEVNVKGEDKFQDITFNLPKRIYPIKIRIDLGTRKIETPIKINEIVLSTGTNNKVFKNAELLEYFKPNKFIKLDEASQSYDRKTVEGVYDPYLISINIDDIVTNLFKENHVEQF